MDIINRTFTALLFLLSVYTSSALALSQQIDEDIEEYQKLVERALIYREETISAYREIRGDLDSGKPLSGQYIEFINDGIQSHLSLRKQLYQVVYSYEYMLDIGAEAYEFHEEADDFEEEPSEYVEVDDESRLKGIMLSLSAALILYDNYLLAISMFEDDAKLRRYVNEHKKSYKLSRNQLNDITRRYNSISNRSRARVAISYFQENWDKQSDDFRNDENNAYLYTLITNSPSYNTTLDISPLYVLHRHVKFLTGITIDTLTELSNEGLNLFSLLFGNTVGIVTTRKGVMHDDVIVRQDIQNQLKAGDILLEKTPFRLTDKLIPGYWGHVAIWIGSKEELIELGIWGDPLVQRYHDEIVSEQKVVEALRSGVKMNTLGAFLNVDDLAVLRKSQMGDDERGKVILRALRQIGKPYDFNFDIETNDRIVCSELIYVAYADTPWPTESKVGRHTISPTNIASIAGPDKHFDIVSLYLKGQPVEDDLTLVFNQLD